MLAKQVLCCLRHTKRKTRNPVIEFKLMNPSGKGGNQGIVGKKDDVRG
jgi:hypothetical protein